MSERQISEDKKIKEDQARSGYLKNLLDSVADPIFVKDKQHRWIDGNRAFWELMGGTPDAFIGKSDYDFFPQTEADVFWENDNEVFNSKQTLIKEEFLTDRHGIQHIISTKKALFINEKNEEVLVGIIRDITAEKELESLKNQMTATAISQKEKQRRIYETALSNTADSNYVFNPEGSFIYANQVLLELLGKPLEEVVGKNFLELDYPLDLAQRLHRQILQVAESQESIRDEASFTSKLGTRIYEYIFRPVISENNTVEAVTGSSRDITELKEAHRRKDEFLAMLAHELRNPLAPISNAMHLMKSPSVNEKIREEAAKLVDRQIKQMTHLLNDLLDVSRVTLGKIELRTQKVRLSEIINMAVESILPLIEDKKQKIKLNLPIKIIWLNADVTRLAQVFSNLLNNAAKYTQEGGHIEVEAFENQEGVVVKISDDGIGIPTDMQPQIFDLFAQVDSSMERSYGGLGIGLTLVQNLVEMHGGNVSVFSEGKNKGSSFIVRLPVQDTVEEDNRSIPADVSEEKNTNSFRVLIVDDNEASAKTLGWSLEMLGHEVRLAHDGQRAIEMAHAYKPRVILLDIGLPGMNGYDICKIFRSNPAYNNVLIIAQTGWGQKEHLQRSKEVGFDHHLVKPIRMDVLQELFANIDSQNFRIQNK
jgi:PAS domain S-box-containing protein